MITILPLLLVLLGGTGFSVAEVFTSSAHLQTALYAERDIANLLHSYVAQEEVRLEKIRLLADDYQKHSNLALDNVDKFLGNPVNAFLLIKRFTLDWDRDVLPIISNGTWDALSQQIEQVRADLPVYEDLKGAASGLMRLQDTYQLDTSSVAQGDLGGVKSPVLSASDCFLLGRLSYIEKDYYHCSLWMEASLDRATQELSDSIFISDTLDYLSYSKAMLGDVDDALKLTNELLEIEPEHERALNNKRYFESMVQSTDKNKQKADQRPGYQLNRDEYRNSKEFLTYEALCRGEDVVPVANKDKLFCRYRTNNHPLLLLQPAKEEIVHFNPFVTIFHHVVSDEEIRQIKHLATPRLNRATVQNSKTGELETANYRISKSAWLKGEEHQVVQKLNNRMAAITGLDMSTAEELQIANYGLGGHYEPHFDFARKEEKDAFKSLGTGNRIATFLNYMSDVEAGGATVFPYIGLRLYPEKGSAAFWYNLYKNGEGIYNTRHAACPVLVGTKWVANKWIHEIGQEFTYPCSLNEQE
jgi:prolyl 4-hydroxylase